MPAPWLTVESQMGGSRRDAVGVAWLVGAGLVTLLPALVHGASLGPMQELSSYGVLQHFVQVPNGQSSFHGSGAARHPLESPGLDPGP